MKLHVVTDENDVDGDWRWQLKHAARTAEDLTAAGLKLSDEELKGLAHVAAHGGLPLGVTPHFLALLDPDDDGDPLRLQVIPRGSEFLPTSWDRRDPLGEEELEVVPSLVHRYPDRVLLLATDRCAAYCRFCTRKRLVGQGPTPSWEHLERAFQYIAEHPEIHEVIVSGGDAMMLGDDRVALLLQRLRAIGHLDVIRIASRMLAFCPQRVTPELVALLKNDDDDGPVTYWLSHFNHERELQPAATRAAIALLVDGGVPVLNQTVLLRGVNDGRDALLGLFRALTRRRVRPYYLHQCDLAPGTDAFRVPLQEARELYASLRGHLSGISLPTFVVDLPGGKGKQPLSFDPVVDVDAESVTLRGYRGDLVKYPRR
ncbi:MAG: KamA family radical SAM protein [Deltaproteobacteria bacterium]|nr:KamA family radical SAM protein [Deltaproteobacteria bacterium]